MIRAFYSGGSGIVSQQAAIDNAANNIANINTNGFKKQKSGFSELLNSNMGTEGGTSPNTVVGNGSRAEAVQSIFTEGSIQPTGNALDFAVGSDCFFAVKTSDGSVKYTKDGSFRVSSETDGNYLVTADGGYVLDGSGNRISADEENLSGIIGVYTFSNPYGLRYCGGNRYEATAESGGAAAGNGKIISGSIELSNVDLSTEMTDLMDMQRSFQFNARLIQTADEIEGITNNLR